LVITMNANTRGTFYWLMVLPVIIFLSEPANAFNEAQEQRYCQRGQASSCRGLAKRMEEAGNFEEAYRYYRRACVDLPPRGAILACSYFFKVAKRLDRVNEAGQPLEAKCLKGNDIICYHLAKAYLDIEDDEHAEPHLARLCEKDFRLAKNVSFGPCSDLAGSFERRGKLTQAHRYFQIDCERDHQFSHMSCTAFDILERKLHPPPKPGPASIKAFVALLILPFLSLLLLIWRRPIGLKIVRLLLPVLFIGLYVFYESTVSPYASIRIDMLLIIPAGALVFIFAFAAHRALVKQIK